MFVPLSNILRKLAGLQRLVGRDDLAAKRARHGLPAEPEVVRPIVIGPHPRRRWEDHPRTEHRKPSADD